VAEPVGREPDLRLTRAHGRGGDAHHSAVNPPPRSPVGSMPAELGHWCAGGHTDEVKLGRFMGTEIFVIDADTDTDVSRRLRRLGATVIAVPSLSARDLPSAYDGKRPDLRPACTTRPDRRRSHLHVRSSRAVVRGPDAAEAATMLTRRDRTAATISYDLNIAAVAKGRLSPADLTSIESMIGCSDIVTLSEGDLKSLRPGERHADAVRWLMTRDPRGDQWHGGLRRVCQGRLRAVSRLPCRRRRRHTRCQRKIDCRPAIRIGRAGPARRRRIRGVAGNRSRRGQRRIQRRESLWRIGIFAPRIRTHDPRYAAATRLRQEIVLGA
jgi:hypothetical protein